MLGSHADCAELTGEIYHRFSRQVHRSRSGDRGGRDEIFRLAVSTICKEERGLPRFYLAGRDTRGIKALEVDLLDKWRSRSSDRSSDGYFASVCDRLLLLDIDLRAPVILRDHLNFDEESCLRILELRWGVFRHRLHRGRMELQRLFQGAVSSHKKRN